MSDFVTPWTAPQQASLSFTVSRSLLKLVSVESVMPSNHLILCRPLLLLPSVFPSMRALSTELALCIKWPKYWSFSISPSNEYSWFISFRIDWFNLHIVQFSSVLSLSRVWLFPTARQGSLSVTNSQSLLKPISTESVMKSNYLILCHPFLLPPSIFPSIRVFSNESVLRIRWSKHWSFSFKISLSNEYSWLISLQFKGLSRVFSNTTVQMHQIFST